MSEISYHQPLVWIKISKAASLLRRLELRLSEFEFDFEQRLVEYQYDIKHRSGNSHTNADSMSRLPSLNACDVSINDVQSYGSLSLDLV